MSFSLEQLLYVAKAANKAGDHGLELIAIIPPSMATQGIFDFQFVYKTTLTSSATSSHWSEI